ncbi:hypothetical protein [Novosphingobium gossypii]|uniref:hypothetical protein n=1 Tax=Novosphingobium gossypii TaxID=1604774 RepID=UPI003D1A9C82
MLALMRGGGKMARSVDVADLFAQLRILAAQEGYPIMPGGTPYLSDGELVLLSWLAVAQRMVAPGCKSPGPPRLALAIENCAKVLTAMRLRLYPLSLYAHRVRGAARC